MSSYLVTGSNRGLGLAFVQELLKNPENKVVATARNAAGSEELQALAQRFPEDNRLALIDLDITDIDSINRAVADVDLLLPGGLDNLISNAGVAYQPMTSFEEMDIPNYKKEIEFNVVGTLQLLRGFLPLVQKSKVKKIMVLTSSLGSIDQAVTTPGLANAYSVAKAGLNMLIRKWSATLKSDGITAALIHPGWVKTTDMGNTITPWMAKYVPGYDGITIDESSAGVIKVLDNMTIENSGTYYNVDGTIMPW
ncbi:putative short-chain dehydrogenases/reductase [Trichoderma velutinum]